MIVLLCDHFFSTNAKIYGVLDKIDCIHDDAYNIISNLHRSRLKKDATMVRIKRIFYLLFSSLTICFKSRLSELMSKVEK